MLSETYGNRGRQSPENKPVNERILEGIYTPGAVRLHALQVLISGWDAGMKQVLQTASCPAQIC